MHIIGLIIIGAAAGFLATRLMKIEADILTTLAIGSLGALVGGVVLEVLITVTSFAAGFIGAVLGAMVLIWLWRTYGPKRG